ncbi:hypothetical protein [Undibacterium sp.]|uniref:hypothetical protein n=1 Tax=Undibacterium sp. TaxID=1914977 RepID=UPI002CAE7E41|nr:hypothetical protein [Undibacterium sp.]HTD03824.1 hypothetical protein [Undibacterium sp.]
MRFKSGLQISAQSFLLLVYFSMYIVAIAWIYVVLMMSITESTVTAGIMTFLMYCVLPLTIILYLVRSPQRKKRRNAEMPAKSAAAQDEAAAPGAAANPAPKTEIQED